MDLVNYMVFKFFLKKSFPSTCPLFSSAQGEMCVPHEFKIRTRIIESLISSPPSMYLHQKHGTPRNNLRIKLVNEERNW